MPAHDPTQRSYAAQIAARKRWGTDASQARQALKVFRAEDYVRKLVTEAPPLTLAQRNKLVRLLRGPLQPGGAPPGRTRPARHGGTTSAVSTESGDAPAFDAGAAGGGATA